MADVIMAERQAPINPLLPRMAEITAIHKETADISTYSLKLKEGNGFGYSPGLPGQFNMVGVPGVGEAPISISGHISNSGHTGEILHTIRAAGRVTRYLGRYAVGDEITLRGPYGKGWPLDGAKGGDVLIVAGGVGLAPLRPAIEAIIRERGRFGKAALIYGAKHPSDAIFGDYLDNWASYLNVIRTVDEAPAGMHWHHRTGLVTDFIGEALDRPETTTAFICGPELMMRFVSRRLSIEGMPGSKIFVSLERRMKCGTAQCGHCQHGPYFVCKDGPVFSYKDIRGLPDGFF